MKRTTQLVQRKTMVNLLDQITTKKNPIANNVVQKHNVPTKMGETP